jgi:hypothetical protein
MAGVGSAAIPRRGPRSFCKAVLMAQLILQNNATPSRDPCGICGRATETSAGTQLVVAETGAPVCAECGRAHAPSLAALVDLADTAGRVGRIGRHSVFPPLSALLDLASAAEKYTSAAQAPDPQQPPGSS